MMDLESIRLRLQDRRLDAIRNATGLSKFTIINIRDGKQENPSYGTLKALSGYFEDQEKSATAVDG